MPGVAFILIVIALILSNAIKILREWERGVILRLGKFQAVRGPGITFVIPIIERMYRINTRVITVDVPPQDVITRDNVTLKVNAVVFFRILGPREAVINVEDFYGATFQKAQTVLRNVLGQFELDGILAERAMVRQAEAERERRSKVISAEGEYQASTRLAEAADIMGRHPMSLQLRFLQTLAEVATENNSTIVFPVPIDLVRPLLELQGRAVQADGGGPAAAPGATPPES